MHNQGENKTKQQKLLVPFDLLNVNKMLQLNLDLHRHMVQTLLSFERQFSSHDSLSRLSLPQCSISVTLFISNYIKPNCCCCLCQAASIHMQMLLNLPLVIVFFSRVAHFVQSPSSTDPSSFCVYIFIAKNKREVKPKCEWQSNVNWLHSLYYQPLYVLTVQITNDKYLIIELQAMHLPNHLVSHVF